MLSVAFFGSFQFFLNQEKVKRKENQKSRTGNPGKRKQSTAKERGTAQERKGIKSAELSKMPWA